ncbi:class I SAM-dependent methyltransferase [Streptomyces sp. AC627_RSS907]|uniref:class I SAM-dependent methyltransferase n=1 Tax=Streptomyces sp. AC627_RSS907 TaxID=2823684 RepID=UPI001C23D937|nr:class I SAM-dependent methyltransferase [Streptomyces sp. AC627_RSS907]
MSKYILGRSPRETHRLDLQSRLYAAHSAHLLRLAGLRPGMRVVDVGCGTGELTRIAARIVGPSGQVIGVDRDPDMLAVAEGAMARAGLSHMTFRQDVLPELSLDRPVDALVGRLIVMHLDSPADAVRRMARHVRPGGVVTFQDLNLSRSRSVPGLPLVGDIGRWIQAAFRQGGTDPDPGERLPAVFRAAGLPAAGLAVAVPAGDADSLAVAHATSAVTALLPLIEKSGVATAAEIDPETLHTRLTIQMREAAATLFSPELTGVWATSPTASPDMVG